MPVSVAVPSSSVVAFPTTASAPIAASSTSAKSDGGAVQRRELHRDRSQSGRGRWRRETDQRSRCQCDDPCRPRDQSHRVSRSSASAALAGTVRGWRTAGRRIATGGHGEAASANFSRWSMSSIVIPRARPGHGRTLSPRVWRRHARLESKVAYLMYQKLTTHRRQRCRLRDPALGPESEGKFHEAADLRTDGPDRRSVRGRRHLHHWCRASQRCGRAVCRQRRCYAANAVRGVVGYPC